MKGKQRIFVCGLAALLCAQILYGALIFSSLYKQFLEPPLYLNSIVCRDIADHLSLITRTGKKLTPRTAAAVIGRFHERAEADDILVTDAAFRVIARTGSGSAALPPLPDGHRPGKPIPESFTAGRSLCASHAVEDRHGNIPGHVFVITDRSRITSQLSRSMRDLMLRFLAISLAEITLFGTLLLALFRMQRSPRQSLLQRVAALHENGCLRACLLIPLCLGQILFLFAVNPYLARLYDDGLSHTGHHLAQQMQGELSRLARMGMPPEAISGLDRRMVRMQEGLSSFGMAVSDPDGRIISAAGKTGPMTEEEWRKLACGDRSISLDIPGDPGGRAGSVSVAMDWGSTGRTLRTVLLDTLTMTVVAAVFLCELLFLLLKSSNGIKAFASAPAFMRPIVFACLFATEMSMSYVPMRIGELGLDLLGLPPDVVSGLPVSCELLMAGIAMIFGGAWSQKSGWRPMLLAGVLLCCAGAAASTASGGPLTFIAARGLCGLGYGFINLAAQVFVIAHSDSGSRAGNLAFMFAGLYAGTLCGSTFGGLIADRLGYQAVFPVTCAMLLMTAGALFLLLPREEWAAAPAKQQSACRGLLRFLADRRMGSLLLFLVIPNALITVCLFQYFIPLSLSKSGVSPASIGRIFLCYCLIVMYAGPFCGRLLDRSRRMPRPLFCAMLLASCSVAALLAGDRLPGAALSVILLAVSTAIVSNGQGAYALSLPAAAAYGKARTMGAYNVAMRLGQVLGPVSLGFMTSLWSVRAGLSVLAAFAMFSALAFLSLSFPGRTVREEDA